MGLEDGKHLIESHLGANGVGVIKLCRQEKRNALTRSMCSAVSAAIDEIQRDDRCIGLIICAGDGAFCAGADLSEEPPDLSNGWHWRTSEAGRMFQSITSSQVPVIVATEGITVGLAVGMAAYATYVVASESADFWLPEASQGYFPFGAMQGITRRVSPTVAFGWAVTSTRFSADDAHEAGLVTHLCDAGDAVGMAHGILEAHGLHGRSTLEDAMRYLRAVRELGTAEIERWCEDEMTATALRP